MKSCKELAGRMRVVVVLMSLTTFSSVGCTDARKPGLSKALPLEVSGEIDINGKQITVSGSGIYNSLASAYEFDANLSDASVNHRDRLLLSFIPRSVLAFLPAGNDVSLLDKSKDGLTVKLDARRKVDEMSSIKANIRLTKDAGAISVSYNATITTPLDGGRPIEPDGEAVVRLGVNPASGAFVGGARINYDITKPDSAGLGTADFWNLNGSFEGVRDEVTEAYAHVDHCGGNPAAGLSKGVILRFGASTVFEPGIITLSGVAKKDGVIHQYLGVANQTGGGQTLFTFPVRINKGMTAAQVASKIEEGFTNLRDENELARHILAVQGGDGVRISTPDRESARVAVTMTVDGTSIARPDDPNATALFDQTATQAFSDQQVLGSENTGIRNQFGVLGEPPLTGWLTPFKVVFSTNNPRAGNLAAGGTVSILLNWTDNVKGRDGLEGSRTNFADLVIPTRAGDTAEAIVERLTQRLKEQRTGWGTYAFTQRSGNVLYIDAGFDFPHSVSLSSEDVGVGYMSAAADLPFFKE